MSIRELIYHKHYWSIPHCRETSNRIFQICYDCGKERESPIRLGSGEPVSSPGPLQVEQPVETDEPAVSTLHSGRARQPDLLDAIVNRLYAKKKLVGG